MNQEEKPFWTSRTFWTGAVMLAANAMSFFGGMGLFGLTPEKQEAAMAVLNGLLAMLAIYFRWEAKGPLTPTDTR